MNQRTITLACAVIVALYGAVLMLRTAPVQGWPGAGTEVRQTSDYVSLWTAGRLAIEGRAHGAYDWPTQKQEFERLTGEDLADTFYLPFPYPPTFLAVMSVFALLPYGASHLAWVALTLGLYVLAARRITGSPQGALWMCAPVAVLLNADAGQTGALSAGLLGLGLYCLPQRPVAAGLLFGLLAYKPHLGLLLPLALAAAGHWRAFAAAAMTAVVAGLTATLVFGLAAWPAFLDQMGAMASHIQQASSPWKLQSVYGLLRTLGLQAGAALALHGAFCLVVAAGVALVWRQPEIEPDLKAAALGAATVLMSPYLFIYDMTVLMVAQAFLLRTASASGGLTATEGWLMAAANGLILLSMIAAIPSGLAAPLILLALALRRMTENRAACPSISLSQPA